MSNHSVRIKNRCAWWQIWQKKNNRVLIGLEYPHSFWRESKIFPHGTNPVPFICGINFFRDRSFVYSSYSFRLCQLIAIRFFHVCATWLDNFFLPFFEKLKVQLVKKYDNAQKGLMYRSCTYLFCINSLHQPWRAHRENPTAFKKCCQFSALLSS